MIELIVSLFLFCIVVSMCLDIYIGNLKNYNNLSGSTDSRANLRIAMDFTADHIREGLNVVPGVNSVSVDGSVIYVKNNILRFCTDSQQVASSIDIISVEKVNETGLYKIIMRSGGEEISTFIEKRK